MTDEIVVTAAHHALARPDAFYAGLRNLTGPLDQEQVAIVEALLKSAAHWPLCWLAYGLATAWHEARFRPQAEWGKGKGRPYAAKGKYGQPQYGRGLVQLTWDRNYEWADEACELGGALLKNFDLALEPEIAVRILVKGMATGAFTGKSLRRYMNGWNGTHGEFVACRKIINGTDKAQQIAGYGERIQEALREGGWA
jgi:hypothetical protein